MSSLVRSVTLTGKRPRSNSFVGKRRRYRKSRIMRNPYSPSTLHSFTRKCACTIGYTGNLGWKSAGVNSNSMSFAYSLGGTLVFIGGTNVFFFAGSICLNPSPPGVGPPGATANTLA